MHWETLRALANWDTATPWKTKMTTISLQKKLDVHRKYVSLNLYKQQGKTKIHVQTIT